MKKKTLLLLTSLVIFLSIAVAFVFTNNISEVNFFKGSADSSYTLNLNSGVSVTNDYAKITNERGVQFGFKFSWYTAGSNKLGTLAESGEILNYDAFHSITSINISVSSGSLSVFNGWKQYSNSDITYGSNSLATVTFVSTVNFADLNSPYIN